MELPRKEELNMYEGEKIFLILCASGSGKRMNMDTPKQFLSLNNRTILEETLEKFVNTVDFDKIVIVVSKEYKDYVEKVILEPMKPQLKHRIWVVVGGKERQDSVYNGLRFLSQDIDKNTYVLVHDSVRPYVSRNAIIHVIDEMIEKGNTICAVKPVDTVRHKEKGIIDRNNLYLVSTPQGYNGKKLLEAYEKAKEENFYGTDDSTLFERYIKDAKINIVEGNRDNIKITTREDLKNIQRIGTGYDAHRLVKDRELILGGVRIPFEKGLLGHSDADVLIHALIDSILGALSLGDIGKHFPDNKEEFKDISSLALLEDVKNKMDSLGYTVINCDMTIKCEKPKLKNYIDDMRKNISETLKIGLNQVSIKATTTEGLGFEGRGEGISAEAIVLLQGTYIENSLDY